MVFASNQFSAIPVEMLHEKRVEFSERFPCGRAVSPETALHALVGRGAFLPLNFRAGKTRKLVCLLFEGELLLFERAGEAFVLDGGFLVSGGAFTFREGPVKFHAGCQRTFPGIEPVWETAGCVGLS